MCIYYMQYRSIYYCDNPAGKEFMDDCPCNGDETSCPYIKEGQSDTTILKNTF